MFNLKTFLAVAGGGIGVFITIKVNYPTISGVFLALLCFAPLIFYTLISLGKLELLKLPFKEFRTKDFNSNKSLEQTLKDNKKSKIKDVVLTGLGYFTPVKLGYLGDMVYLNRRLILTKKRGIIQAPHNKVELKESNLNLLGTDIHNHSSKINPLIYPDMDLNALNWGDEFKSAEILEDVKTLMNDVIKGVLNDVISSNVLLLTNQKDKEKRAK